MPNHFPPPSSMRGFTLVELILAVSLAAAVLVLVSGGMYLVTKDWERSGNRLEDKLDTGIALLQLEQALHGAFPHIYKEVDEDNTTYVYFEGEDDRVTWVSTVSPQRRPGFTAWLLEPGKKDEGLMAATVPAYAGNPEKSLKKAKRFPLFEGYKVRFEYLYIDPVQRGDEQDRREWRDEWSGEKRQALPAAVRLHLEKQERGRDKEELEMIAVIPANEHIRYRLKRIF